MFLSGFNRDNVIRGNEFVWLGQNAIASWGILDADNTTKGYHTNSGLGGLQPRGTLIDGNWVHEIGHIQKQSSFYFQAITAQTTIQNNVVFNIPRAGINFVRPLAPLLVGSLLPHCRGCYRTMALAARMSSRTTCCSILAANRQIMSDQPATALCLLRPPGLSF